MVYHPTGRVARQARRSPLAHGKTAAYVSCLFGMLSFLAVIMGYGGIENLFVGFLCSGIGTWRLYVLYRRDYLADLESYQADRHDADRAWWLNAYRTSDSFAEREAARQLLLYWGHQPQDLNAAIRGLVERVQAKADQWDAGRPPFVHIQTPGGSLTLHRRPTRAELIRDAQQALDNLAAARRTASGDIILRDTRYPRNTR